MTDGIINRSSGLFIQVPHDLVRDIKNANAFLVYSVLRTYMNQGSGYVFPKRETIADHIGAKTVKPVDSALKVLEELGLVASFHRFKNENNKISFKKTDEFKHQTSNGYIIYDVIHKPGPGWDDPTADYTPPTYGRGVPKGHGVGSQKATPPGSQMETPRVAEKVHEVYPLEVQPLEAGTPLTPQGGNTGNAGDQIEIINAVLIEEKPDRKKSETNGHRLPKGWMPTQRSIELVRDEHPGITDEILIREHRKFSDHWAAATGQRARKKDWDATWRNWIRTAMERHQPRGRNTGKPTMQEINTWTTQPTITHQEPDSDYRPF